ncbi:choice-of-anchor B family protein [Aurantibacter sp.]|uniref:choice-of-anchor B family protein n=1 Tax=Aurantibacter sp. TaxID=2807103 RepID=UPI0032665A66
MKKFLLFTLFISVVLACSNNDDFNIDSEEEIDVIPITQTGNVPCEGGLAGEYPCNDYDQIGNITLATFGASSGNDCWGWTDPDSGKEYALMGLDNGTVFVDISDDQNLVYLGKLPTATVASSWRDVKVYENHAYIVSEAQGHGMQVFDLTRLRNVGSPPETFDADFQYTEFGNAHNIVVNEETGFAYAVGTTTFSGGGHFVNIQNPKLPVASGGHSANGYTHDAQAITYNGPDSDYSGKEIFIGANEDRVAIIDVTDKANPQEISTITYDNFSYTHQGWFTEDQQYFILGDETDETNFGFNSRTLIFDFADLDNPVLHDTYLGPTAAIDHNGYVLGNQFYLANYTAGMRVLDISNIEGKNISEVGFFDTHPSTDKADFNGVWSVYPFFLSGKILISDINRGLFIVKKSN